jgi:ribosomal protein L25 (general stress protein Ctc)
METTVLKKVKLRDQFGTRAAEALRKEGGYPANIIGGGKESRQISLDQREFDAAIRHGFRAFNLENVDEDAVMVLQEVQWDAMGDFIQHVDFMRDADGSVRAAREAKAREEKAAAKAAAEAEAEAE